jgi:hypothetical protein
LRIKEMPFVVLGEREHGKSRVASNVVYFASHLVHILLRAVRDGRPMRFFSVLSAAALLPGTLALIGLGGWHLTTGGITPLQSVLTLGVSLVLIGVVLLALALLADMVSRHRLIHEELLYLARRHYYARPRPTGTEPDSEALIAVFDPA